MKALALGMSLALALVAEAQGQACWPRHPTLVPGPGALGGAVAGGLAGRALAGRGDDTVAAVVAGAAVGSLVGDALLDRPCRARLGVPWEAPAILSDRDRALDEARRRQAAHAQAMREHGRVARSVAAVADPGGPLDVARAQRLLMALGHYEGPIDGRAGPRTRSGVMGFEASQGLPPTGTLTRAILQRMRAAL